MFSFFFEVAYLSLAQISKLELKDHLAIREMDK